MLMLIALTCPQIETQTKKGKFVGRHVRYILLLKEQSGIAVQNQSQLHHVFTIL